MATLGFEDYIEPLKVYLARYREVNYSSLPNFVVKAYNNTVLTDVLCDFFNVGVFWILSAWADGGMQMLSFVHICCSSALITILIFTNKSMSFDI